MAASRRLQGSGSPVWAVSSAARSGFLERGTSHRCFSATATMTTACGAGRECGAVCRKWTRSRRRLSLTVEGEGYRIHAVGLRGIRDLYGGVIRLAEFG